MAVQREKAIENLLKTIGASTSTLNLNEDSVGRYWDDEQIKQAIRVPIVSQKASRLLIRLDAPDALIQFICEQLKDNTSLKRIDIHQTGVMRDIQIFVQLVAATTHLQQLEMVGLNVNDFSVLEKSLLYHASLSTLHIERTSLDEASCVSLARLLSANTPLRELYIGDKTMTTDGTVAIANAVGENSQLTALRVLGRALSKTGFVALVKSVAHHKSIRSLGLTTPTSGACIDDVIAMLSENSSLREFSVNCSPIASAQDVRKVLLLLSTNMQLLRMAMLFENDSNTPVLRALDQDGATALAAVLEKNRTLTYFYADVLFSAHVDPVIAALKTNFCIRELILAPNSQTPNDRKLFAAQKEVAVRNRNLQWKKIHPILLEICIAMAPLRIPSYVMLEIVDWFEFWFEGVSHVKKIQLIESINASIRRIRKEDEEIE